MKSETEKFLVLQAVCWWTCGRPTDRQNDGQECGTAVSRDLLEYTAVVVVPAAACIVVIADMSSSLTPSAPTYDAVPPLLDSAGGCGRVL